MTYAARIAQTLNAELIIVNIINVRDVEAIGSIAAMGYEVDSEHCVSGIKEERQQALSEILARIAYPADKMRAVFQVRHLLIKLSCGWIWTSESDARTPTARELK